MAYDPIMIQKNLLILCGGISAEHEISLSSARFIAENIDKTAHTVTIVIVGRDRQWIYVPYDAFFQGETEGLKVSLVRNQGKVMLMGSDFSESIDVVFPAIHGPSGEDGSLQGLLEYLGVPYVGNGVLASAVAMNKISTKHILLACELPVVPFFGVSSMEKLPTYALACQMLKSPILVIKPACSGSSIGVSKVSCEKDYIEKSQEAFAYSSSMLIEPAVTGSEVECAILGNASAVASGVGEIVVYAADKMYSYQAKYQDPHQTQARVLVQAKSIDAETQERIRTMALRAFHALTCSGLARVDFFVTEKDIFINEINTMPGFTAISLYPKLWDCAGIPAKELISRLIEYANERFHQQAELEYTCKTGS
jgi:D-alanine-D-alanine ligase